MAHIVVYDKKSAGSPIVGTHSAPPGAERVELEDIHPGADPNLYGVLLVADDVITQMTVRKLKPDRKGKTVVRTVLQEKSKDLVTVADSSLGENILVFGEPYTAIKSVTDLNGQKAAHTAKNPAKGIIGVGTSSGYFTVACKVDTGVQAPEAVTEKKNWEWERDSGGTIVGMRILKKLPSGSRD